MKAKLALLAAGAQLWAQEAPEDALFDSTLRQLPKGSDSSVNSVREVLARACGGRSQSRALADSPHERRREASIKRRNHSKDTHSQHCPAMRRPEPTSERAATPGGRNTTENQDN